MSKVKSKSSKSKSSKSVALKIETHAKGVKLTDKRPGVIACIIEALVNASKSAPVSKSAILAQLVKRFPERDEAQLKSTLSMQCPSGLRIEKSIEVISSVGESGKGYWIERSEYDAYVKRGCTKIKS